MTQMTKVQAEALTALIVRLRPEWRPAGVMAALEKAKDGADTFDVSRALINLAADASVITPGLLHQPGPHWLRPDGSKPARRGDSTMRCPEHGEPYTSCGQCKTADYVEMPDTARQALAEAIEAGKSAIPFRERKPYSPKGAKKS